MSYILDALKQSETQRKQDTATAPPPAQVVATRRRSSPRRGRLPLAAALVMTIGVLGWWYLAPDARQPAALESSVANSRQSMQQDAGTPGNPDGALPAPAPANVAEMVVAAIGRDDLKGVRIQLQEPAPAVARTQPPVRSDTAAGNRIDQNPAGAPAPGSEENADNGGDAFAGVPFRRQLPVDVQRSLPELTFSVHIYSKDPASRRVKVGERMLREGQRITPQLRLEAIIPRGVILTYEDYRFRMSTL